MGIWYHPIWQHTEETESGTASKRLPFSSTNEFRLTMSNNCSHLFLVILVVVFLCKSSNQLILFKKVYLAHWFCILVLWLFLIIIPIFFLFSEVAAVKSDSPDITPKKDKSAKDEVTKITRPQGRLVWT